MGFVFAATSLPNCFAWLAFRRPPAANAALGASAVAVQRRDGRGIGGVGDSAPPVRSAAAAWTPSSTSGAPSRGDAADGGPEGGDLPRDALDLSRHAEIVA